METIFINTPAPVASPAPPSTKGCNQQNETSPTISPAWLSKLSPELQSKPLREIIVCSLSQSTLKNNRECKDCHSLFNWEDLIEHLKNVSQACPKCDQPVRNMKALDEQFTHNPVVQQIVSPSQPSFFLASQQLFFCNLQNGSREILRIHHDFLQVYQRPSLCNGGVGFSPV